MLALIDIDTPLRYCSGQDPILYGGTPVRYDPHPMWAPKIPQHHPRRMKWRLGISDPAGAIHLAKRADRSTWLEKELTVYLLGRVHPTTAWTLLFTWVWQVSNTEYSPKTESLVINLDGAGGMSQRAGLALGTKTLFPHAPDGGQPWKIGFAGDRSGFTFSEGPRTSPPPPGGEDPPYDEPRVRGPILGRFAPGETDMPTSILRESGVSHSQDSSGGS